MSPPAVELRSPVSSPPPDSSSAPLQNPKLKPGHVPGDPSGIDVKSASVSQRAARSRPRLVKVRKRAASKVGTCEVSSNNEFAFLGDSLKFGSSFVFTDDVQKKLDSGNIENEVFVFGAKLSNGALSSETPDIECEQSAVNCGNLVSDDAVKMKADWKWENLTNDEKLHFGGGRMKMDSVTIAAMSNNAESRSVADTIDQTSTAVNAEEVELGKIVGKVGIDSCSNLKTGNYDFLNKPFDSVFGDGLFDATTNVGSFVSDSGVKKKAEAEFQKAEASNVNFGCEEGRALKEDLGRDVFVFGSSSLNEVSKERRPKGRPKTPFTLPDEMKNLNINDSGNINGYDKPKSSNATFAATSSSSNGCDEPSGFSNGCVGNTDSYSSEGLAGSSGRIFKDPFESSGKSNTELQSDCDFSSAREGCSSTEPFNFLSGRFGSCDDDILHEQKASTKSSFSSASFQCQSNGNPHVVHLSEVGKNDENSPLGTSNNVSTSAEFKIPQWDSASFKENLFSDLNRNPVSSIKSKLNKTKKKKTRGNLKPTKWQDKVSKDNDSSQVNLDSPGSCTPMDFSPYQETVFVDQNSRDKPGECSHPVDSSAPWMTKATVCTEENDASLIRRKVTDACNGIWKHCEPSDGSLGNHRDGISFHSFEGLDSKNEIVCSSPKTELCCGSDFVGGVSSKPTTAFNIDSGDSFGKSFTFSASSVIQASSLSATKNRHRKKNEKKSNHNVFVISPSPDIKFGPSFEFSSIASPSLQSEAASKFEAEEKFKPERSFSTAIQETCEKWRLRGNQAYKNGEHSKAEDLYTQGIVSVPPNEGLGACLNSLMLCYSNRAATRMSLGKIRKAIEDCEVATKLDPNFRKVQVRAANCHLLLGEIENALQYFNKCLESRDGICLDRRMIIEAADGLQNAQKVAEYTRRSSELMKQKTDDATLIALDLIAEAVSISLYSDKLLEMKAEALLMLQRYEEAIKLCEQSLCFAEKNCIAESDISKIDVSGSRSHSLARLWRWCLITKALFFLGNFESALDTVGKIEQEKVHEEKSRIESLKSSFTLADTIRGLMKCKSAGNEAFRSGKYTEAAEHYTVALSINVQSRSFTAVCLCNRAAAYQALGQIADAISDCNLAIALDENYSKAFSRRANLHEMIRDHAQAASDLKKFIFIVENQSDGKVTPNKSAGSVELKKARRKKPLMEEAAKKEISLDFYLILGVKATDTASDVKKAYRKAALKHHPDKAGVFLARNDSSHDGRLWKEISQDVYRDSDRLFKLIGEAYAVLSDSSKRSNYDVEEEMRKAAKNSNRSSNKSSNSRSSQASNFHGSPFERSANGRNYRDNWKSWGSSQYRW